MSWLGLTSPFDTGEFNVLDVGRSFGALVSIVSAVELRSLDLPCSKLSGDLPLPSKISLLGLGWSNWKSLSEGLVGVLLIKSPRGHSYLQSPHPRDLVGFLDSSLSEDSPSSSIVYSFSFSWGVFGLPPSSSRSPPLLLMSPCSNSLFIS